MPRNRPTSKPAILTSRPWRVQFEQSPLAGAAVYKFPVAPSDGAWVELPGRARSAYRTLGGVIQFIAESHGLSGKHWRALLAELAHAHPLPIEGVFEGVIFCADGRLRARSMWITDDDAARLDSLDEASLRAACMLAHESSATDGRGHSGDRTKRNERTNASNPCH